MGGFDDGRWNHAGRAVHHATSEYFLDVCVQRVMLAFQSKYPSELNGLDLSFFDAEVLSPA
jgi:hypothetical protein